MNNRQLSWTNKYNNNHLLLPLGHISNREYFCNEFYSFCAEHDFIHERTPPYSPQSNGVAERKNRTLTDLVNAMLDTSSLSKAWWGEAILTACHVLNKVPTKDNEIIPMRNGQREVQHSRTCVLGAVWRKSMCRSPKSVSLDRRLWTALIWAAVRIALAIDF